MERLHLQLDLGIGLPLLSECFSKSVLFMFIERIADKAYCIFFVLNDCLKTQRFSTANNSMRKLKRPIKWGAFE